MLELNLKDMSNIFFFATFCTNLCLFLNAHHLYVSFSGYVTPCPILFVCFFPLPVHAFYSSPLFLHCVCPLPCLCVLFIRSCLCVSLPPPCLCISFLPPPLALITNNSNLHEAWANNGTHLMNPFCDFMCSYFIDLAIRLTI